MTKNNYYINGIGIISPQRTYNNDEFLPEILAYNENVLTCVTPEFKDYINPVQLRRLSRMLRIGLSAATICVRDSNNTNLDGIITATGYGFLKDTSKFIQEMYSLNERQLTPTFFMQSTYNALAGLVALTFKCNGYNNTYVNKGFAFETSLQDAMMQLNEDSEKNFLVGSYDETDEVLYAITSRYGHYKKEHINSLELYKHKTTGSIQGEGSAYFLISGKPSETSWCILKDVQMVFMPEHVTVLRDALKVFLSANNIALKDIDVFVSGVDGDIVNDQLIAELILTDLQEIPQVRFKHLSGEYCTASAFGMWLAASILRKQEIPSGVKFDSFSKLVYKTALVINHYKGRNYSFTLLQSIS
jgi:3-oxoacyl-[acyl-carrier-protein] synthase II